MWKLWKTNLYSTVEILSLLKMWSIVFLKKLISKEMINDSSKVQQTEGFVTSGQSKERN